MAPRRNLPEAPSDGGISSNRRTVESYERIARGYAEETSPDPGGPSGVIAEGLRRMVGVVGPGGTALEVGSGPGWDADYVESLGVTVRRTDVTAAFIELQAERGKAVEHLDVISDDLGGPYDAVMALAVLQHVARDELAPVVRRVAAALPPGGAFLAAVREGDGESWEVGDSGNPYYTVLWREPEFLALLVEAGLEVEWRARSSDSEENSWLTLLARRRVG